MNSYDEETDYYSYPVSILRPVAGRADVRLYDRSGLLPAG